MWTIRVRDRGQSAVPRKSTRMRKIGGEPRKGAQSLRRALAVLRVLAAGRETGLPLSEVVAATGLTRPTAHRIVHVLMEEGIVERNARSKRFAIGQQVPELALARQSRSRLIVAAEPYLAQLSREVGDTVFLTIRTGLDSLCVARWIGTYPIQVLSIEVGARRPLGVSSAGVAILSALPPAEARQIVSRNQVRFGAYRMTPAMALQLIAEARQRGYGIHHIGLVPGTKAISATIGETDGRPIAAITIAAIRSRLGPRREGEVGEILTNTVRSLEKIMHGID
jgi:DNA-binding IclR family transcriptional regulator